MKIRRKSKVLLLFIAVWLLVVCGGLRMMLAYDNSAGTIAAAPTIWPADSHISRRTGIPTLVMMIHPHCPCSRASIGELALLMSDVAGPVNAHVLFIKPHEFSEEWEKTDLWESAAMIPGVKASLDDEGAEARLFGSETSGQVMLYDMNGQLLFKGGITASRGHAGENDGRRAIVSLLTQHHDDITETPVFGCPLFDQSSNNQTKDSCHAFHQQ
jgi:hypothetical protein